MGSAHCIGEVLFLLYDALREPRAHLAMLEGIGNRQHTFKGIKDATLIGDVHLPAKQRTARQGRYHLSDPFMRFYVRFIHPHRDAEEKTSLPAQQDQNTRSDRQ